MNQSPLAKKLLKGLLASGLVVTALTVSSGTGVRAQAPCSPNPIACENLLTGNPSTEWDITGAGDSSIQGFATDISVNHGQIVRFKINTDANAYRLDRPSHDYASSIAACLLEQRGDRPQRLWQLGGIGVVDSPRKCGLGYLHREGRSRIRCGGVESHRLRRQRR
jgi:hypothetical protein